MCAFVAVYLCVCVMHEYARIAQILWSQMAPNKVFVAQRIIFEKLKISMTWACMAQMQIICNAKRNICEKMDN
jgi:hypothetical protein